MRRLLLAGLTLAFLLHCWQAVERCRRADQRIRSAREELSRFEEVMKEWPELQLRASRVEPPRARESLPLPRIADLEVALHREPSGVYRLRLSGPRPAVVEELLALNQFFWLQRLDLKSFAGGQVRGGGILVEIP